MSRILVAAMSGLILIASSAQALDPTRAISQYAHTAWRLQDGYLGGIPTSIVQTRDGYLWIGTQGALFRFDGVRFVLWTAPEGQKLPSDNITSLAPSIEGGLWIGTSSGLAHWTGQMLTSFAPAARIDRVIADLQGNAWIVRSRTHDSLGPLCEAVGSVLQCHGAAEGIPANYAGVLTQDTIGNFWIGITDKLVRWRPGSSTTYPIRGLEAETGLSGVQDIVATSDNSLWVGMDRSGRSLGLQRFTNGRWSPFVTPTFDSSTLDVATLFLDRNGDLWVGTRTKGIYRIHDRQIDHFDSSDGLSGDSVNGLFQDREGNIWVATSSGIDSFRDLPVATFSTHQGLSSDQVHSILAAHDGTVWIGTIGSLDSIRAGRVSSIHARRGLPGLEVTAMLEDKRGQLWVGVDNALYLYGDSRFKPIPGFDGKPAGLVYSMAESPDHSVWGASYFSQSYRLARFEDEKAKQKLESSEMPLVYRVEADPRDGIWVSLVAKGLTRYQDGSLDSHLLRETATLPKLNNFFVDTDGSAWMGTTGGLAVWKKGTLRLLAARNGLPCDTIYSLLWDAHQALWLYSHCGLVRIEGAELDRWWANPDYKVKALTLDAFCGAQPALATFTPAATRSSDGRLWFTNDSVVQMVDPDHLDLNPTPPPVHVEQVLAQGHSFTAQDQLQLPPHTRDIQIDYTALSFASPQRVLFRIMLQGHESRWIDVGTRRSAFYTNLGPGRYRFQVIASNNDGVWNEVGAKLDFRIVPAWYQTNWFRLACVGAFLASMWGMYRLRLQQLRKQFNVRMEERVNERTRIARELHDTLLQSLHGLMFEFQAARNMFRKRPHEALQALDGAIMGTERAITESQDAIENLRSTVNAEGDLAELVKMVGEDLVAARNLDHDSPTFGLTVEGQSKALTPAIRDEIYRIARELLRNAFRHARAQRIEAEILYEEEHLRVRVRDDGKGIDPQVLGEGRRPGHWGLPGIRERANQIGAKLDLWSEAGAGTEVQLAVAASTAYLRTQARSKFRMFQRTGDHEHRS